jgi:uncharacterized protein
MSLLSNHLRRNLPLALIVCASAFHVRRDSPRLTMSGDHAVYLGVSPAIEIQDLKPHDTATVVAFRRMVRARGMFSNRVVDTVVVRSVGVFVGPNRPRFGLGDFAPIRGTWTTADSLGFLWSMAPYDTVWNGSFSSIAVRLEQSHHVVDTLTLSLRGARPGVAARFVATDRFAGGFAYPSDVTHGPTVILLHGGEGGDTSSALARAESFANNGFAAMAVTYFARGPSIPGIPSALVNIPIETLDAARDWLGRQAPADTSRLGIWGESKGAEFALVAASRRSWPHAVVACVPSSVVTMGVGPNPTPDERLPSWSDSTQPLPIAPYHHYEEVLAGKITPRAAFDRSLRESPDSVVPARIRVELIRAPLLLQASERDVAWPSADMARSIREHLQTVNPGADVRLMIDPLSGHAVCGDGASPMFDASLPTDTPPQGRATAHAAANNWRATISFLRATLAKSVRP